MALILFLAALVCGYLVTTLVALKGGPADFPDNLAAPAMLVHDGRVIHGPIGT